VPKAVVGSKRSTNTVHAPASSETPSTTLSPKMWNSGSATTTTSSSWNSTTRPGMSAFMYSVKWESTAPFGTPVVPEV